MNQNMKKIIYFLLVILFLSASNFEANAQSSTSNTEALGKQLYQAADNGKTAVALDLIKQGANLNYLGEYGTAMDRAALNKDLPLVKALLEAGADPNLSEPIHNAVYNNNVEMVELLIKYKANVNARNENGYNALHIAALWNPDEKVTAILLKAGANPKVIAKDSHTPLTIARKENKSKIAGLLDGTVKITNVESSKSRNEVQTQSNNAEGPSIKGAALYKLYMIEKPLPEATDYASLEANYHQQVIWRTNAVMESSNEIKKVTGNGKSATPEKLQSVKFVLTTRVIEARAHIKEAIRELNKFNNPQWQQDRKFYDDYLGATETIAKQLGI
jgi:ankyrin repeat protein